MYIVVMIMGALGTVAVTSMLTARTLHSRDAVDQSRILAESKQVLIGWAITSGSTASPGINRPGDLPAPDVADTAESTPNYDGDAESGCLDGTKPTGMPLISASVNVRCLGRLPWRLLKASIPAPSEQDAEGRMPWYAVSANLTRIDACLSVLNSELITRSYPGSHVCASMTSLPYPWLTVRDTNGNVLSNRVAFVVIVPGGVVGNQQRRAAPNLGGASDFLDSVTVASGCSPPCTPGTYSNADLDNDFIAGDASNTFNDRLLYVTIDDLMAAVENHVASTIAGALRSFSTTYSDSAPQPRYPWLAAFNPAGGSTPDASVGTARGMVPTHVPDSSFTTGFTWTLGGSPPVDHGGTVNPSEIRNYTVPAGQGSCLWSPTGMHRVECTASVNNPKPGVTRRSITLRYTGSTTTPTVSNDPTSSNLVISPAVSSALTTRAVNRTTLTSVTLEIIDYDDSNITTSWNPFNGGSWVFGPEIVGFGHESAGGGYSIRTSGITFYPVLPAWYVANEWHRFTYAAIASGYQPGAGNNCAGGCLSVLVNTKTQTSSAQAVVLGAGPMLSTQNRSPHNTTLSNYFDSSNNWAFGSNTFDRQTPRSSTFNDQVAIVAQ